MSSSAVDASASAAEAFAKLGVLVAEAQTLTAGEAFPSSSHRQAAAPAACILSRLKVPGSSAVCMGVLVWEWIVTLPLEYRLVWKHKLSFINGLCHLNRYGTLAELAVLLILWYDVSHAALRDFRDGHALRRPLMRKCAFDGDSALIRRPSPLPPSALFLKPNTRCERMFHVEGYWHPVMSVVASLILIARAWALWDRSRIVLGTLV